jgi:hypothetical protein
MKAVTVNYEINYDRKKFYDSGPEFTAKIINIQTFYGTMVPKNGRPQIIIMVLKSF